MSQGNMIVENSNDSSLNLGKHVFFFKKICIKLYIPDFVHLTHRTNKSRRTFILSYVIGFFRAYSIIKSIIANRYITLTKKKKCY